MRKAFSKLTVALGMSLAAAALGGPPLLCHPYVEGEGLADWPEGGAAFDRCEAFLGRLRAERETLVRMEMIRRARLWAYEDRRWDAVLAALREPPQGKESKEDPRGREGARFDLAFAEATFRGERPSEERTRALAEAVEALQGRMEELRPRVKSTEILKGDVAAAWLALARAKTPLMRTGTMEEHARAFVRAETLAASMPKGPARERIEKTLAHDLSTLEAHLLDKELKAEGIEPDPRTRLEWLRKYANLHTR